MVAYQYQSDNNTEDSYRSNDTDIKWKKETVKESNIRDEINQTLSKNQVNIKLQTININKQIQKMNRKLRKIENEAPKDKEETVSPEKLKIEEEMKSFDDLRSKLKS